MVVLVIDFDSVVSRGVVLVDFWAEWCPHCLALMPQVDAISMELDGRARVLKINVSEAEGIAQRFGITSLPTFAIFKDGVLVDIIRGALSGFELKKRLLSVIE